MPGHVGVCVKVVADSSVYNNSTKYTLARMFGARTGDTVRAVLTKAKLNPDHQVGVCQFKVSHIIQGVDYFVMR